MALPTCPNCHCQLEVKLIFASGPKSAATSSELDMEEFVQLLEAGEARYDELDEYDKKFIEGTRERYDQYGPRIKMSDKQMAKLRQIAAGH